MLERASSCLESGARLSLRCAQRTSKSKRQLHSAFWTHGASHLDLASLVLGSGTSLSGSNREKCDDTCEKQKGKRADGGGSVNDAHEGVVLDFLYPPQTVTWFNRVVDHQWERWEKRNARRLPRGFVHASREYSSRSSSYIRGQSGKEKFTARAEPHRTWKSSNSVRSVPHFPISASDFDESFEVEASFKIGDVEDKPLQSPKYNSPVSASDIDGHLESIVPEIMTPYIAEKRLNQLMKRARLTRAHEHPEMSLDFAKQAWDLYEALGSELQSKPTLVQNLLQCLSKHRNSFAETRCMNLYNTLSTTHRTLPVYKDAIGFFLRCGLIGLAEQAYSEAFERLPNTHSLSLYFIIYALEHGYWDLAYRVKQQRNANSEGMGSAWLEAQLWEKVAELPNLLDIAISLAKHSRMQKRAAQVSQGFDAFCISLFREAIIQDLKDVSSIRKRRPSARRTLQNGKVRALLTMIRNEFSDAPAFYEDLLYALILPGSTVDYTDFHEMTSWIYQQWIAMPNVKPSGDILTKLLRKVISYETGKLDTPGSSQNLTVEVIFDHWAQYKQAIPIPALGMGMRYYALRGQVSRVRGLADHLRAAHPDFELQRDSLSNLVLVHARRVDVEGAKLALQELEDCAVAAGKKPAIEWFNLVMHAHMRADDFDGALKTLRRILSNPDVEPSEYTFHPMLELYAARGDVESVESLLRQYDQITGRKRSTAMMNSLMLAHIKLGHTVDAFKVLCRILRLVKEGELTGSLTHSFNLQLTALALDGLAIKTMRTYLMMRKREVPVNANTYAALMQGFVSRGQPYAAQNLLTKGMKAARVQPMAFHFAIVMAGFVQFGMPHLALKMHDIMKHEKIMPSPSSNRVYLQARAQQEAGKTRGAASGDVQLTETVEELRSMLNVDVTESLATNSPQFSKVTFPFGKRTVAATYYHYIISTYGKMNCLRAAETLLEEFTSKEPISSTTKETLLVTGMIDEFMALFYKKGDYEAVHQWWDLAVKHANILSQYMDVPDLTKTGDAEDNVVNSRLTQTDPSDGDISSESPLTPSRPDLSVAPKALQFKRSLSTAFGWQVRALLAQKRISEIVNIIEGLLGRGYQLDKESWNSLLQLLIAHDPPLTLLAFILTERYLITQFVGWRKKPPSPQRLGTTEKATGMAFIKMANRPRTLLLPSYKTIESLAEGLYQVSRRELALRRKLASRRGLASRREAAGSETKPLTLPAVEKDGIERYVGTFREVSRLAPATLRTLRTMPKMPPKKIRPLGWGLASPDRASAGSQKQSAHASARSRPRTQVAHARARSHPRERFMSARARSRRFARTPAGIRTQFDHATKVAMDGPIDMVPR